MADVNISKYRASVVRSGSTPATPGFVVSEGQNPVEPAGSEQNHLPVTINPTANALAITTDQVLSGAGTVGQYIRGDGSLADFPSSTGGGSSVSYYLNGSVNQGTIGGVAYKELSKTPILGSGTNFTINANGYIASFLTDAGDPNLLEIPGGNWNFETYFSASSGGGSPTFYVELYKYNGSTFTLIASNSGNPELIAFGTNVTSYFSTLAVPTTALTLTDRLAIRYYVTHSGRTITLHTENNHLCQVITTFTTGLTALNGLTAQVQYFAVGTSGTDFNIASATQTHTFNLPTASATNRGALSSADWSTFNAKQNALTLTTSGSSGASTLVGATLNVPTYTLSGLGGVPTSRQLTINGTAFDLSADRSWSVGTVTSVGLSSATSGVTIGNTPVTGSGTITLAIATATSTQQGLLSSTDWSTFNNKQNALTLTTTGTSGAATLVGATLNIPQYQAAGTYVTSVTASSPLASSGGTTPNITIQQASGSQSGFLSSTDWTTFNNKQNALTNPITGTGTTNYLPKFTGSTTIGNSQVFDNGTNVGIGTASPSTLLQVFTNTSNAGRIRVTSTTSTAGNYRGYEFGNSLGFRGGIVQDESTEEISIFTPIGGNSVRISASGNLGLGVTPSAGGLSGYALFQIAAHGTSIYSGTNQTLIGTNVLWSGGSASYSASTFATLYNQQSGQHQWFNAPSGTAGNAITFTQAMTLNASGNLLVGTTSDNGARLQVSGAATFSSSVTAANFAVGAASNFNAMFYTVGAFASYIQLANGSTGAGSANGMLLGVDGSGNGIVNVRGAVDYITSVAGLERFRITSGGNVGIGTSSPTAYTGYTTLHVGSATSRGLLKFGNAASLDGPEIYTTTNSDIYFNTNSVNNRIFISGSSGNVLIGTTTDNGQRLQVNGTGGIRVNEDGSGTKVISIRSNFAGVDPAVNVTTNNSLLLMTNNTERMRITSGGNVLIGTTTDNSHKLRVNGTGYFDTGIKTGNPVGSTTNDWLLGRALVTGTSTPDRWIRVQIGNLYYDILAVYMGSV